MTEITELKANQIFVFGSNRSGFHGAGSAGLAMRGDSRNTWRDDPDFRLAMNSPYNSKNRVGKWAVYGVARGFQQGKEGMSYAIETVISPGKLRSVSLAAIQEQFETLLQWAADHPQFEILMTPVGCGYAGYSNEEVFQHWKAACIKFRYIPKNLICKDVYKTDPTPNLT